MLLFFDLVALGQNGNTNKADWEQGLHIGFNLATGAARYFSERHTIWMEVPGSAIPGFQVNFYNQKKIKKAWFWQLEVGLSSFGRVNERNLERSLPTLYFIGLQSSLLVGRRTLTDMVRPYAGMGGFFSLTQAGDQRFFYGPQLGASAAVPGSGIILDLRVSMPAMTDMVRMDYVSYRPLLFSLTFCLPLHAGEYAESPTGE